MIRLNRASTENNLRAQTKKSYQGSRVILFKCRHSTEFYESWFFKFLQTGSRCVLGWAGTFFFSSYILQKEKKMDFLWPSPCFWKKWQPIKDVTREERFKGSPQFWDDSKNMPDLVRSLNFKNSNNYAAPKVSKFSGGLSQRRTIKKSDSAF